MRIPCVDSVEGKGRMQDPPLPTCHVLIGAEYQALVTLGVHNIFSTILEGLGIVTQKNISHDVAPVHFVNEWSDESVGPTHQPMTYATPSRNLLIPKIEYPWNYSFPLEEDEKRNSK